MAYTLFTTTQSLNYVAHTHHDFRIFVLILTNKGTVWHSHQLDAILRKGHFPNNHELSLVATRSLPKHQLNVTRSRHVQQLPFDKSQKLEKTAPQNQQCANQGQIDAPTKLMPPKNQHIKLHDPLPPLVPEKIRVAQEE